MINNQFRTFFVTAVAHRRRPHFRAAPMAELFIEVMLGYRSERIYLLHEFVLMPDHFHLILTPSVKLSLERALQRIKGGFSFQAGKKISSRVEIWQPSFTYHLILDALDLEQHRNYVLENPVRAGLVKEKRDYPYSSVHSHFKMDEVPEFYRG
jgi:putative transposase